VEAQRPPTREGRRRVDPVGTEVSVWCRQGELFGGPRSRVTPQPVGFAPPPWLSPADGHKVWEGLLQPGAVWRRAGSLRLTGAPYWNLGSEVQAATKGLATEFPLVAACYLGAGGAVHGLEPHRGEPPRNVHLDQPEALGCREDRQGVVATGLLLAFLLPLRYHLGRRPGDLGVDLHLGAGRAANPVQGLSKRRWRDLTGSAGGIGSKRTTGLEPATSSLGSSRSTR
jgi:hypothetical protein